MALLDWLNEEEESVDASPSVWRIPVYYRKWGSFYVRATSREEAITKWQDMDSEVAEEGTLWDGVDELDIEWCDSIDKVTT